MSKKPLTNGSRGDCFTVFVDDEYCGGLLALFNEATERYKKRLEKERIGRRITDSRAIYPGCEYDYWPGRYKRDIA